MKSISSTHRGDVGEMVVALELVKRGFHVSKPMTHDSAYDLVADYEGRLSRIQVKSIFSVQKKGAYMASTTLPFDATRIDFVISYIEPTQSFYIIPVSHVKGIVTLTLSPVGKYNSFLNNWELLYAEPKIPLPEVLVCSFNASDGAPLLSLPAPGAADSGTPFQCSIGEAQ